MFAVSMYLVARKKAKNIIMSAEWSTCRKRLAPAQPPDRTAWETSDGLARELLKIRQHDSGSINTFSTYKYDKASNSLFAGRNRVL